MKCTRRASQAAGTTSHAFVPVINRHFTIFGLFPGVCKKLATPDAFTAVGAFVIILHYPVIRSFHGFGEMAQAATLQYRAATAAAVTAADKLGFLSSHGESIETLDHHGPQGIELIPQFYGLFPANDVFRKGNHGRHTYKSTPLVGHLAAMAMKGSFLLLAHAVEYQETVMPLEVGVYIVVRFPLEPFGFKRTAHGNGTLRAGPGGKDFLTSAFNNILLEDTGKFSTFRFYLLQVRFVPANQEREKPVFLHGLFFSLTRFCLYFPKSLYTGLQGKGVEL